MRAAVVSRRSPEPSGRMITSPPASSRSKTMAGRSAPVRRSGSSSSRLTALVVAVPSSRERRIWTGRGRAREGLLLLRRQVRESSARALAYLPGPLPSAFIRARLGLPRGPVAEARLRPSATRPPTCLVIRASVVRPEPSACGCRPRRSRRCVPVAPFRAGRRLRLRFDAARAGASRACDSRDCARPRRSPEHVTPATRGVIREIARALRALVAHVERRPAARDDFLLVRRATYTSRSTSDRRRIGLL